MSKLTSPTDGRLPPPPSYAMSASSNLLVFELSVFYKLVVRHSEALGPRNNAPAGPPTHRHSIHMSICDAYKALVTLSISYISSA